jgi:hypothetical protein
VGAAFWRSTVVAGNAGDAGVAPTGVGVLWWFQR